MVWFYGISTIVGYLMLNSLYIWFLNTFCKKHFLNEPGFIFFTQLNGFTYLYLIQITINDQSFVYTQFNVFQVLLFNTNNLIKHQSFVYTQMITHSPNLKHYWSLIIRLFSVISRTLIGGTLPLWKDAVDVCYSPNQLGQSINTC